MTEQEKKRTPEDRKQVEKNRDAAMRQRDLLGKMLEARKKILSLKMAHYAPGKDFKENMAFQAQPEFWEATRAVDEVNDVMAIMQLEGQIDDINDRIKVYTETLSERG
jgi:hypothetical protein